MNSRCTPEIIKARISVDDAWLMRGVLAIYAQQTAEEQRTEQTIEKNGVGFNGCDAVFLSSIAEFIKRNGFLTPKQLRYTRMKMIKYSGQLARIANEDNDRS